MSLYTGIKLMVVVVMGVIAMGAFMEAADRDFQPPRRTRVILFITGFSEMLAVIWLMFPEPWYEVLWLKLAGCVVAGYFWAFTMPERWRYIQRRMREKD
jgi:predicted membrane channel-forming protein YqfA (hemolysin III family)